MARKKKKQIPPLTNIYVLYSYKESGGGVCEGQEDYDWPNYEPLFRDHEILGISLNSRNSYFYNLVQVPFTPVDGDRVYLVSVIYQSGGTFITTFGNIGFVGIYKTYEEADYIAKSIKNDSYDGYKFWQGYFERLQHIEVSEHILNANPKKTRY